MLSKAIYFFSLCLEIVFILIKAKKRVKGINIFKHTYMSSAYKDDTAFFLRNRKSIKELIKIFVTFSKYSGLKLNHKKCEIAGIGVLQSVEVTVCGMKCTEVYGYYKRYWNLLFVQQRKGKWKREF